MIFWFLAIAITAVAAAALLYAALGRVSASGVGALNATEAHFRAQLQGIDVDIGGGKLLPAEGVAARAELARELLRQRRQFGDRPNAVGNANHRLALPLSVAAIALIAFVSYAYLGSPGLPSAPLAARQEAQAAASMSVPDAIKAVEARLAANPEDLRGWQVIAPIYMQSGDYPKAEHAFRQILALAPPTAAADTDLAEALMMAANGAVGAEAGDLLHKAVTLDAKDPRPRFYLAADAMRQKNYLSAVQQWTDIVALGNDDSPWMPTAKAGLAAAEAGRDGKPMPGAPTAADAANPAQSPAIANMVAGLADRLDKQGGSLEEWTQLVRSEIVLGDMPKAQSAYNAARKAYPDAGDRAELDGLAAQAGLKIDGRTP